MKYLPLREIDDVTDALNFETTDCRIVGSCDIYITKAGGTNKNLYKQIETSLESQHEAAVRFSASLSPPEAEHAANALNLSRSSPFGPLSQISSRRTFAYLIATLNASHPDYDFSQFLRPSDFRREKRLQRVIDAIDTTLFALRPKSLAAAPAGKWAPGTSPLPEDELPTPKAESRTRGVSWGPKMWQAMDKEMSLEDCIIYSYEPEEDPYDDDEDEPSIWSFHYFFFNKAKKRVCYLHLRALSLSNELDGSRTPYTPTPVTAGRTIDLSWARAEPGSAKRAKYWLGEKAVGNVIGGWDDEDDTGGEESDHKGFTDTDASKYDSGLSESPSPDLGRKHRNLEAIREAGRDVDDDIADAIEL